MESQVVTPSPDEGLPRALELKAAAILLVLAALLVGAVVYVMYARGVFEKSQTVILIAEDAGGIDVGMEMTFAGFPIGRVTRVTLHDDGRARLRVEVPQKQTKWLRESSVFTLEKSLIGSPQLKAFTGLLEGPLLPDGAERTVLFGDVSAQIPQITLAARELLEHLSALTNERSALAMSLENLRVTTQRLNGPQGVLGVVMGNSRDAAAVAASLNRTQAVMKALEGLLTSTNGLVKNADSQMFGPRGLMREADASARQVNELLSQLRTSMLKVDDILKQGQGIAADTKSATTDLVALRAQVEASLRRVDALIHEVDRAWPLARDVEVKLP